MHGKPHARSAANADDVGIKIFVAGEREPKPRTASLIGWMDWVAEASEEITRADDESRCWVSALVRKGVCRTLSIGTVSVLVFIRRERTRKGPENVRDGWRWVARRGGTIDERQMHEASLHADESPLITSMQSEAISCRANAAYC